jgi:hypothetical protein
LARTFDVRKDSQNLDTLFASSGWRPTLNMRERTLAREMDRLARDRMDWTTIAVEKYQDLRNKLDEANLDLELAKAAVENSDFRERLIVNDGGRLMTYAQAKKKFCSQNSRSCHFQMDYQLKTIADARALMDEGEKTLSQIAREVLDAYEGDSTLLHSLANNPFIRLTGDLPAKLTTSLEVLDGVTNALAWDFSALHDAVRDQERAEFASPEERSQLAGSASAFISQTYFQGFDELAFYSKLSGTSEPP